MNLSELVRGAAQEYNADFRTRAWVAITMGVLTSLLTYVLIMVACFLFLCLSAAPWYLVGTALFAAFFIVSWRACQAREMQAHGAAPPVEDDPGEVGLPDSHDAPASPVQTAFALVMHGPASIVKGRRMLNGGLPTDEATMAAAGEALGRLLEDRAIPLADFQPPVVATVLLRTGLAKPSGRRSGGALVVTVKARQSAGRP